MAAAEETTSPACSVVVAPQLIYDQTSSNAGNYTAQGVGNNSCCSKTLPVSADDAARPLVMMMLKHQLEYGNMVS